MAELDSELIEEAHGLVNSFEEQFGLDYSFESLFRLEELLLEAIHFVPPPFRGRIVVQSEAYALVTARKLFGGVFTMSEGQVPSLVVTNQESKAVALVIRERIENILNEASVTLEIKDWLQFVESSPTNQ